MAYLFWVFDADIRLREEGARQPQAARIRTQYYGFTQRPSMHLLRRASSKNVCEAFHIAT